MQTLNHSLPISLAQPGSTGVRAEGKQSSGRGSGRLTFRSSALQPRIPPKSYCNCRSPTERERRAGCSCHRRRAGACFPHSFAGSSSARRRRAVRPSRPARSLARQSALSNPLATEHDTNTTTAYQPLKDKGPARWSYPANPQPTTILFICIRAAIGLCKSACSDNLTSAPGTRPREAEEGGARRKQSVGGGGGRGSEPTLSRQAGRVGEEIFVGGPGEEGVFSLSLSWSWLALFFLIVVSSLLFLGGCY